MSVCATIQILLPNLMKNTRRNRVFHDIRLDSCNVYVELPTSLKEYIPDQATVSAAHRLDVVRLRRVAGPWCVREKF